MSVTSITEDGLPELSDSLLGAKTVTRRWVAKCTLKTDGPLTVQAHADCPVKGSTYNFGTESDATLVCTDVRIAVRVDSHGLAMSKVFDVTATYSNDVDAASIGEDEEDPLDDPPEYEFTFQKYQVPAEYDRDGNAVVNGAGEKFDPPWMVDENRPVIIITRNEASFNPSTAINYQDTVNEHSWAGVDAGCAKINGISARNATRGEISYAIVTYEIELRWQGWNPTKILAQGYRYRKSEGGPPLEIIDEGTGIPPASPKLLQLNGMISPPVDGVIPAFFHEYTFFRETDFSALNLGL
jgi:hypothetical protein